jgi:hypothetical protein
MSAVLPRFSPVAKAVLCLLALVAFGFAQASKPDPFQPKLGPEGSAYNSQEFRFRIVLPTPPTIQSENDVATSFNSAAKDDSYRLKVLVIALNKASAAQDAGEYFAEFNKGMRDGGTQIAPCAAGLVSGMPAERCSFSKYDSTGMMIVVRRAGAAYFVSGEQERGGIREEQIAAAVSSFRLLPELETFTYADQGFRADFPTRPKLTEKGGGVVVQAFAARDRYMTMVSIDDLGAAQSAADPARLFPAIEHDFERSLAQVHMKLTGCEAVEFIGGLAAHHCQYDDDKNSGTLLIVRKGKKLYGLLAHQPIGSGSSAELDAFLRSFKFLQ